MAFPTDIIAYIGIPHAVLGRMAILYTTIKALLVQKCIRREFVRNGLSKAIIRGSLISLVVEIELPRYILAPMSRSEEEYWKLNPSPRI